MNFEQQEMRYSSDPDRSASKRVAYLSPMKICKEQHNFRIGYQHDSLEGLEPVERKKIIDESRLDYKCKYDLYIDLALLKYQDRECVVSPYNFG